MTPERRRYNREYARRKRAERVARENASRTHCVARFGSGFCNGLLESRFDAIGRSVLVCPWCARKARGICRDCSQPVEGRVGTALRCARHKDEARRAQIAAHKIRNKDEIAARNRVRYHADAERKERKLEYKRAWRKANREKVRAQKRRESLRQSKRRLKYHERYRAKHRDHLREVARARYYRENPERPTPTCNGCGVEIPFTPPGRPMTRCDACVPACVRRQRQETRSRRAALAAAQAPVEVAKPKRIRRPRTQRWLEGGHHLCAGEGCDVLLTGRKKKCARCKARELDLAQQLLAQRRGRGRRIDLQERVA